MHHANPYRALIERVRNSASAPAVTFYDGAERIELSYKSLENWVAKTSNFLIDEIEINQSDAICLDLPPHWLKVVWLLAIWASGARIVTAREEADYVVSDRPIEGDDIYCSLRVMGKLPEAPRGFIDFITEVRSFGDFFSPTTPPTEIDYEDRWQVPEQSRVLMIGAECSQEQIAAALVSKSSIVILRNADDELVAKIERDEKTTCVWR